MAEGNDSEGMLDNLVMEKRACMEIESVPQQRSFLD